MQHPNGVQPLGNCLLHGGHNTRHSGASRHHVQAPNLVSLLPVYLRFCWGRAGQPISLTSGLAAGLGGLARLSDELLLGVLARVGARGLVACAGASKALHCFATHEELWRAMTLQA